MIQNNGISSTDPMDYDTHIIAVKQIAFNLFDMNCDNYICQYDLFSVIKNLKNNELFIESINQDFKDIRKRMTHKENVEKAL